MTMQRWQKRAAKWRHLAASGKLTRELACWWSERRFGRFAQRFGLNHAALRHDMFAGTMRYRIEGAGPVFSGRVEALRLIEMGRFGNVFFQLLHAAMIARRIGVTTIEVFPFRGAPPVPFIEAGGLRFVFNVTDPPTRPTFVGAFFHTFTFPGLLNGVPESHVTDIVDHVLRHIFAHLLDAGPQGAPDTIVAHLRGGDVFEPGSAPINYVQPPASYYHLACLQARESFGVRHVVLVSEDRRNPAIVLLEQSLVRSGFTVRFQSASFEADASLVVNAAHIVASFGTFCEALGMLSTRVHSYTAFRHFESHRLYRRDMKRHSETLLVLQAHGVKAVRIVDTDNTYVGPESWDMSDATLQLLCEYPQSGLHIDYPQDARDDHLAAVFQSCFDRPESADALS